MIARRRKPKAIPASASTHAPSSSGPRCRSVSAIAPAMAVNVSAGGAELRSRKQLKPHRSGELDVQLLVATNDVRQLEVVEDALASRATELTPRLVVQA